MPEWQGQGLGQGGQGHGHGLAQGLGLGLLTVGECQSLFVIAPSWEIAWELMTEEVS